MRVQDLIRVPWSEFSCLLKHLAKPPNIFSPTASIPTRIAKQPHSYSIGLATFNPFKARFLSALAPSV